jgi:hypothetical protein
MSIPEWISEEEFRSYADQDQEVFCACGWTGSPEEVLRAKNPFKPSEFIYGCPRCKQIEQFKPEPTPYTPDSWLCGVCDEKKDWTCPTCGETMPANCLGCGPGVHHTCMEFSASVECGCCHQIVGLSQSVLQNGQELCKECAE